MPRCWSCVAVKRHNASCMDWGRGEGAGGGVGVEVEVGVFPCDKLVDDEDPFAFCSNVPTYLQGRGGGEAPRFWQPVALETDYLTPHSGPSWSQPALIE